MVHFPKGKHADFVRLLCSAWKCLRGVEEYQVDNVLSIEVFQQIGSNEWSFMHSHNHVVPKGNICYYCLF